MVYESIVPSHVFSFTKNKDLKFTGCNEYLAAAAGLDSPAQIVGKTDYEVICWQHMAEECFKNEVKLLQGEIPSLTACEKMVQVHRNSEQRTIITTVERLCDKSDHLIGLVGSAIDMDDYVAFKKYNGVRRVADNIYIDLLENDYLTLREYEVLKYLLMGMTAKMIARKVILSPRTVEQYIKILKLKFQCTTKSDLIYLIVSTGLIYTILEKDSP